LYFQVSAKYLFGESYIVQHDYSVVEAVEYEADAFKLGWVED